MTFTRTASTALVIFFSIFITLAEPVISQTVGPDGSFNYRVDIEVPPGTAGMQPKLALVYNSNAGNGVLGMGWQLEGLPCITRDTTYPINYNGNDHYVGPGGRLVLINSAEKLYHTEEETFSRFKAEGQQGDGPQYWVETKPDGSKYYYGQTDDSRVTAINYSPSVRVWALCKVEDVHGNYYTIEYEQDEGEFYPVKILYTQGNGLSNKRTINISYNQNTRTDVFYNYAQNSSVRTKWRLENIEIRVDIITLFGFTLFDRQVRKYEAIYFQESGYVPSTRIDKINVYGSEGGLINSFTLSWDNDASGVEPHANWVSYYGTDAGWEVSKHPRQTADFNGDGIADIVGFGKQGAWVSLSIGNGFTPPQLWTSSYGTDAGWELSRHPRNTADVNGDGKLDIVGFGKQGAWVSLSTGSVFTTQQLWTSSYGTDAGWELSRHPRNMADVNGDEKADVVGFGKQGAWVSLSTGSGFTPQQLWTSSYGTDAGWEVSKHPRYVADVNGDGKADIVGFGKQGVWVSLSTGSGFTPQQLWINKYGADDGWEISLHPRMVFDLNGDGKADLIGFGNQGVFVSFSNGYSFTEQIQVSTYFGYDTSSGYWQTGYHPRMMADVNGDGKADIVGFSSTGVRISLSTCNVAHKISSIALRSGSVTSIDYTNYSDRTTVTLPTSSVYPYIANNRPREVVKKVTIGDGRSSSYSTNYTYEGAKVYMGLPYQRRDLYFERITAINEQTTEKTVTYYKHKHNGEYNWQYHGRIEKTEQYDGNGVLISSNVYNYADDTSSGFSGTRFVKLDNQVTTTYEGGSLLHTITRAFQYDGYGNVTKITDTATGMNSVVMDLTYVVDTENWIINRLIESKKTAGGSVLLWQKFLYTSNDLTEKQDYLNPGGRWLSTKFGYDAHGNVTSITDPLNHVTSMEYDSDYHTFVTKITNALGHQAIFEYDARWGAKTLEKDPNGNETKYEYDEFGRLTKMTAPGDSWTREVYYLDFGDPNNQRVEERYRDGSSLGYHSKIVYFDGLNRKYKEESLFSHGGQVYKTVVYREYNTAGRLYRESKPYMEGCDTPVYYTFDYDARGRIIKKTHPDGGGAFMDQYSYSINGDRLRVTHLDRALRSHIHDYDARGKLRYRTDPEGAAVSYTYDDMGRLTGTVTALMHATTISYDTLGRKTAMTDPNTGSWQYAYDDAGNLTAQTDAAGTILRLQYDTINRVVHEYTDDGTIDVTCFYDETTYANGKGRLTRVIDAVGTTKFSYTAKGSIAATVRTIGTKDYSFGYTYTVDNKLDELTYPDGKVVKREYADAGFIQKVTLEGSTVVQYGRGDIGEDGDWCNDRRVVRLTGNGVRTEIDYDEITQRPLSVITKKDATEYENITYNYNAATGNITKIQDNKTPTDTQDFNYDNLDRLVYAKGNYGERTYAYNADGNLTGKGGITLSYNDANHPYAVTATSTGKTYTYDARGNMVTRDGKTLNYDAKNRLVSIYNGGTKLEEYTYDYSGFRVKKWQQDGTVTLNLGGLYSIKTLTEDTEQHIKYIHGIQGDLVAQVAATVDNTEAGNYLIGWRLYNLKDPKGFILAAHSMLSYFFAKPEHYRYMAMGLLILAFAGACFLFIYITFIRRSKPAPRFRLAYRSAPLLLFLFVAVFGFAGCELPLFTSSSIDDINYFHPDHLGSVKYITNNAGGEIARYHYTPYGELVTGLSYGTEVSKYKFTAQEEDSSTGLYYFKARFYDPAVGRFVSADSVVPGASNTQSLNRYTYVYANPVSYYDPRGNNAFKDMWNEIKKVSNAAWDAAKDISGYSKGGELGMITTVLGKQKINIIPLLSVYGKIKYTYKDGWSIEIGLQVGEGVTGKSGISWTEKGVNKGISIVNGVQFEIEHTNLSLGVESRYNIISENQTWSANLGYEHGISCVSLNMSVGYYVVTNHNKILDHGPQMQVTCNPHSWGNYGAKYRYSFAKGEGKWEAVTDPTIIKEIEYQGENNWLSHFNPSLGGLQFDEIEGIKFDIPLVSDISSQLKYWYNNSYYGSISAPLP